MRTIDKDFQMEEKESKRPRKIRDVKIKIHAKVKEVLQQGTLSGAVAEEEKRLA